MYCVLCNLFCITHTNIENSGTKMLRRVMMNKIAKHHLKLMPVRRVAFAKRDSEVDGVWKRMVPVGPVVRADSVISADVALQRPHEHHVRVDVDSAILDHKVDSPNVRHVRQHVHHTAVHLSTVPHPKCVCKLLYSENTSSSSSSLSSLSSSSALSSRVY